MLIAMDISAIIVKPQATVLISVWTERVVIHARARGKEVVRTQTKIAWPVIANCHARMAVLVTRMEFALRIVRTIFRIGRMGRVLILYVFQPEGVISSAVTERAARFVVNVCYAKVPVR